MKSLLLMCVLACAAFAAPPRAVPLDVSGDTVRVVRSFPVKVTAPAGAGYYAWTVPPSVTYTRAHNVITVTAAPKGSHKITVAAVSGKVGPDKVTVEFLVDEGETTLVVGDVPGPDPGPKPPDPPVPPAPVGDLRVLEVHEESELPKLTLEQLRIIRGPKFRDVLKSKCGPDKSTADGKAYWMIDKDSDVSRLPKFWQDAMKRPRTELPFLHIFKGETPVYEGPLPTTEAGAIALVLKHAGG